jgi:hypothetical protein
MAIRLRTTGAIGGTSCRIPPYARLLGQCLIARLDPDLCFLSTVDASLPGKRFISFYRKLKRPVLPNRIHYTK